MKKHVRHLISALFLITGIAGHFFLLGGPVLKAGFSRVKITPPAGTPMTGFGDRDLDPGGSRGVHDDLYARALYLSQGDEDILIMGFDLLFFSRDEADRFKGALGRVLGLSPDRILLNTSHTHSGPKVGTWYYTPRDPLYLDFLEKAVLEAGRGAAGSRRDVTVWAGETTTRLPVSRRKILPDGTVEFAPTRKGIVYDKLPFVLFKDGAGAPVCLLFSVACHPSMIKGDDRAFQISADYAGAAMAKLDKYLGRPASLFLQGAGADAKPSVTAVGEETWRPGTWEDWDAAGEMVSGEVIQALEKKSARVEPALGAVLVEKEFPLAAPRSREGYAKIAVDPGVFDFGIPEVVRMWAEEQARLLERGFGLRNSVPILIHGIRISGSLRFVGVEAELAAELGWLIRGFYGTGLTIPLGYSNGAQAYLPSSKMIREGGYEVESFWEYHQPARFQKGVENPLRSGLEFLRNNGIP